MDLRPGLCNGSLGISQGGWEEAPRLHLANTEDNLAQERARTGINASKQEKDSAWEGDGLFGFVGLLALFGKGINVGWLDS